MKDMIGTDFKKKFGQIAKEHGFESAFGGWFMTGTECIIVLELQKSNFGNYYYLNVKIFIQGIFGKSYSKSKDLVKKDMGSVFVRQPIKYDPTLNLEEALTDAIRAAQIQNLFSEFVAPFANKALTKNGIKQMVKDKEIKLFPAVSAALDL